MRCASITWWRISRAQAWLSALTDANMVATQSTPPAICCANAPRGSKEMENSTTTSSAKNSMELMASFERHSMRRSLARWVQRVELMQPPAIGDRGFPSIAAGMRLAWMGHPATNSLEKQILRSA